MSDTFNEVYSWFGKQFSDDHEVLCLDEKTMNLGEYKTRVNELTAHLINLGVRKGDGVGYTIKNCLDVMPLFTAIGSIGAFTIPIFHGMPPAAKVQTYKNVNAKFVVTDADLADDLKKTAENMSAQFQILTLTPYSDYYSLEGSCKADIDISQYIIEHPDKNLKLLVASSSGTTGIPKTVEISQENVGSENHAAMEMISDGSDLVDIRHSCIAFPLSTSVMTVIMSMMFVGHTVVFSADNSPKNFLTNIERWKCELMSTPPAFYESLLVLKDSNTRDLSSLQVVAAGMDFCSPSLLRRLRSMFVNAKYFSNGYGLVETTNIFTYNTIRIDGEEIIGTSTLKVCKTAENTVEIRDDNNNPVKIGETGELYVKGTNVIEGYLIDNTGSKEPFKDGWFRTGDIARFEAEDTITLLGRRKYFIKRGGKSVSPIVVQNELNKVSGIKDSGVVGVPHPLFGEMIWAFVVKEDGCDVSLKDIKMHCREALPYYMTPDQVSFIDEIPKNSGVGKVNFNKLREMAQELLDKINIKN
ncbi:MAG: AMP-binding protein [Oscillospiraceae bacterium]|nr:AMP-binding protein [Oscillospiraceae bacterium]